MGESGLGVDQVSLADVLAEEVERCHEVGVGAVEVPDLAPEIPD